MSRAERAKQFMPFAALRGYGAVIKEKEKIITPKKELTDEQAENLSKIVAVLKKGDVIKVVYYDTDGYVEKTGAVSGVNIPLSNLTVVKTQIPFSEIYSIKNSER